MSLKFIPYTVAKVTFQKDFLNSINGINHCSMLTDTGKKIVGQSFSGMIILSECNVDPARSFHRIMAHHALSVSAGPALFSSIAPLLLRGYLGCASACSVFKQK